MPADHEHSDNERISVKDLFNRLGKLETLVDCQARADSKALILAREIIQSDVKLSKADLEAKLEIHNQWQRRFDKLEGLLATKEYVDKEIKPLYRLVYIGFGLLTAFELYLRFVK